MSTLLLLATVAVFTHAPAAPPESSFDLPLLQSLHPTAHLTEHHTWTEEYDAYLRDAVLRSLGRGELLHVVPPQHREGYEAEKERIETEEPHRARWLNL